MRIITVETSFSKVARTRWVFILILSSSWACGSDTLSSGLVNSYSGNWVGVYSSGHQEYSVDLKLIENHYSDYEVKKNLALASLGEVSGMMVYRPKKVRGSKTPCKNLEEVHISLSGRRIEDKILLSHSWYDMNVLVRVLSYIIKTPNIKSQPKELELILGDYFLTGPTLVKEKIILKRVN